MKKKKLTKYLRAQDVHNAEVRSMRGGKTCSRKKYRMFQDTLR